MSTDLSIKETAKWLKRRDNFLILTHVRPDGDTLGCAAALALGLEVLGKTAYVLKNNETTGRYNRFVSGVWMQEGFTPEYVISVDTASMELLPENASQYLNRISLCIDHHGSNTLYTENVCCFPDYAACGEIIFEILDQLGVISRIAEFTGGAVYTRRKIADCLYVAVSTDTGCFAYSNTTANTHAVAARLIELEASHTYINKLLFRTKSKQRVKIEGMVLQGIEFYYGGQVAFVTITRRMVEEARANEDDLEDVSNIATSIEDVKIGITIREMTSPTDTKISVRTTDQYDASALCRKFGGGGHRAAAGASFTKTADEVKKDIMEELKTYEFKLEIPDVKLGG